MMMKDLPTIKGTRIYLGSMPETEDFYKTYCSWLNQARVLTGTGGELTALDEVIKMHNEWRDDDQNMTFCIYDSQTGEPIGDVCLRYGYEEYDNDGPETAILVGKNCGKGIGQEAMQLVLDYAFDQAGHKTVNLSVYTDNRHALQLYAKLGFSIVKESIDPENDRPEYIMLISREDWLKRRPDTNSQKYL